MSAFNDSLDIGARASKASNKDNMCQNLDCSMYNLVMSLQA